MHIIYICIYIYELIEHILLVHSLNNKYFTHLNQKISFEPWAGQIWPNDKSKGGANPAAFSNYIRSLKFCGNIQH